MLNQQKCLLCGREYPAGLHIMGCLICFPCEKKLLDPAQGPPKRTRRKLLKLYSSN